MCGRFSLDLPPKPVFVNRFRVGQMKLIHYKTRYNIAPQTINPTITRNSPNTAEDMLWWFQPPWLSDDRRGVINARTESIKEKKPFFYKSFLTKRCLVPASSYFEWKKNPGGKIPYLFKLKSRPLFSFAGLYEEYERKGKKVKGFCIITTTPNHLAGEVHNRMPVILQEADEDIWLTSKDPNELLTLLKPYDEGNMTAYPVSVEVNSPINDKEDIVKPVSVKA